MVAFSIPLRSQDMQQHKTGKESFSAIEAVTQRLLAEASDPGTNPSRLERMARLASCVPTSPRNPHPSLWKRQSDFLGERVAVWDSAHAPAWEQLCIPLRTAIIEVLQFELAQNPSTPRWVLLLLRKTRQTVLRPLVEANPVWPLLQLEDPTLISTVAQHQAYRAVCTNLFQHKTTDDRYVTEYTLPAGVDMPFGLYEIGGQISEIPPAFRTTRETKVRVWGSRDG